MERARTNAHTHHNFVEKTRDIVGPYMSPPQNAAVICIDEKSQMRAVRTQPLLPMRPGTPVRRTHDYHRHGTLSLFAGLMVRTGVVIGECHRRHRHQEFIKFLRTIDGVVQATEPAGPAIAPVRTASRTPIRDWSSASSQPPAASTDGFVRCDTRAARSAC